MTTVSTAPRGSGLYLRGRIWWVRVRTPQTIFEKNDVRRFFRFSTGAMSRAEAPRVACHVRAALDRGFGLARLGGEAGMADGRQVEAMLTQLARNAPAAAELSRAVSGVRDEARISQACRRHEDDLAIWRDALRRNEYSRLAAQVGIATHQVGASCEVMSAPQALREAARTLAAVAEKNIAREHGICAADRAALASRLNAAAMEGGVSYAPGTPPPHFDRPAPVAAFTPDPVAIDAIVPALANVGGETPTETRGASLELGSTLRKRTSRAAPARPCLKKGAAGRKSKPRPCGQRGFP